jgi:hypothetical protein
MKKPIGGLLSAATTAAMHVLRGATTALQVSPAVPSPSAATTRNDAPAAVLAAIRIEVILER